MQFNKVRFIGIHTLASNTQKGEKNTNARNVFAGLKRRFQKKKIDDDDERGRV